MRLFTPAALLLCLTLTACHTHMKCDHCKDAPAMTTPAGVYRHVVVFKFKDSTTDEQIAQIIEDFGKLQDDIPEIIAFEHGKNVSPEGLDQGFTPRLPRDLQRQGRPGCLPAPPGTQGFCREAAAVAGATVRGGLCCGVESPIDDRLHFLYHPRSDCDD